MRPKPVNETSDLTSFTNLCASLYLLRGNLSLEMEVPQFLMLLYTAHLPHFPLSMLCDIMSAETQRFSSGAR